MKIHNLVLAVCGFILHFIFLSQLTIEQDFCGISSLGTTVANPELHAALKNASQHNGFWKENKVGGPYFGDIRPFTQIKDEDKSIL